MVAPLVGLAVGAAARAVAKKVAGNAAKKVVTKKAAAKATKAAVKAKEAAKTAKTASNSVKVKPANKTNPSNERINISRSSNLRMMKSGKIAKGEAQGVELKNAVFNPKPKIIKINSNKK
jgi:hypothetical protein